MSRRAFDKAVRRKPLARRTRALWVLNAAQGRVGQFWVRDSGNRFEGQVWERWRRQESGSLRHVQSRGQKRSVAWRDARILSVVNPRSLCVGIGGFTRRL
jgi:hypothetical protein